MLRLKAALLRDVSISEVAKFGKLHRGGGFLLHANDTLPSHLVLTPRAGAEELRNSLSAFNITTPNYILYDGRTRLGRWPAKPLLVQPLSSNRQGSGVEFPWQGIHLRS